MHLFRSLHRQAKFLARSVAWSKHIALKGEGQLHQVRPFGQFRPNVDPGIAPRIHVTEMIEKLLSHMVLECVNTGCQPGKGDPIFFQRVFHFR